MLKLVPRAKTLVQSSRQQLEGLRAVVAGVPCRNAQLDKNGTGVISAGRPVADVYNGLDLTTGNCG
jgi:hypothetical protein